MQLKLVLRYLLFWGSYSVVIVLSYEMYTHTHTHTHTHTIHTHIHTTHTIHTHIHTTHRWMGAIEYLTDWRKRHTNGAIP